METKTQLLIIGAGPAGYTAGIYAARAGISTIIVSDAHPGGQLMTTTDVENYPGFAKPILGPSLMDSMKNQALACGAKIITERIVDIDFSNRPFVCIGHEDTYICESVIIATGANAKWLGLESEDFFRGYGVSSCAVCDGFFFRGKKVVVVGGGNSAVEEALYLSEIAAHVTLIHRRDSLRAEEILQKRIFASPKISVRWNSAVTEIVGDRESRFVSGVILNSSDKIDVDGVFVAIGHSPNSEVFKKFINTDDEGYILVSQRGYATSTNVAGIFAAGDIQDKIYRQAVTAAGQGCMAALDSARFLGS